MNALEQARLKLAKQNPVVSESCTVEEVGDEVLDKVLDNGPNSSPVVSEEVPTGIYANTLVLLDSVTIESLMLDGILSHYDTQFVNIVNRRENLMDDIYAFIEKKNKGVEFTKVIASFTTLSIEQFANLLTRFPRLSLQFYGDDESSVVSTILEEIGNSERTNYQNVSGSLATQLATFLPFRERFDNEEVYTAFLTNQEFQDNLAFVAKNEYVYYKNKMAEFVTTRLLKLQNVATLNQVFLPYKISQINRFTNNHCLYNSTTIVSDYPYNDVIEYVNYLTSLTKESTNTENAEKLYASANALIAFTQNYSTNECSVVILSWNDVRSAELRSRLGECGHQSLANNVTLITTKFTGSQSEFLAKFVGEPQVI